MHILLIEDNEGDILLTTEVLEESKLVDQLMVIKDGEAAIKFFEQLHANAPKPDLVLLDINLPKKSGLEVLTFIKSNPLYSSIPVMMLTTSAAERDVQKAQQLAANFYLTKPLQGADFLSAATKMNKIWSNETPYPRPIK